MIENIQITDHTLITCDYHDFHVLLYRFISGEIAG